jgi:hypothetical protein
MADALLWARLFVTRCARHRRGRPGAQVLAALRLRPAGRGRVALAPFLDLVLAWNTISYGLFSRPVGQWALFASK